MAKSKTKNQKKSRAAANHVAEETYAAVPHSFVFHRGQVGKNVAQLIADVRRLMEPFTAESLKVRKKNVLKDFVSVAGPLGVTHFMIFSKTQSSINMRLARLPKGPTLHFQVLKYSLMKDVVSSLKKHRMHEQQFSRHPLLVLNNFGCEGLQVKLMATMFQNMFPSINVHKVSLNNIKRCVLLNYQRDTQEVELRHYSLKVVPVGMSRGVKKLMQEKFPNMGKFEDISELLMKGANLSESEAEQDGDHNITELPQVYSGRGNMASQQSAVRLTEIGPRMTLQLMKIQEGMGEGNVLYHSIVTKSEEEIQQILRRKEEQLREKQERRRKQEENLAQKAAGRDLNKKKSLEGMQRRRQAQAQEEGEAEAEDPGPQGEQQQEAESDDEAEYYRQAVGAEPDEDMFPRAKRRRSHQDGHGAAKRIKPSPGKPNRKSTPAGGPGPAGGRSRAGDKDLRFAKKKWGGGKAGDKDSRFGKKKWDGGKAFRGKKLPQTKAGGGRKKPSVNKRSHTAFKHRKANG